MSELRVEKRAPKWSIALLGGVLGAIAFFLINTAAPLDVTNDSWILNGYVERDIIQHYLGWLFYRESPLEFPFGMIAGINYPHGMAVTYTDSIPLAAIFFRFFESLLPETFQYFGLYTLGCYVLQGVSAALLLWLFCKRLLPVALGTCLFVCSPIMIERAFRHTALASHFLILFALYLYFAGKKEPWRYRWGYLVLVALATAIHPYFLPMLFGILFADLAEQTLRTKKPLRPALFLLAAFAVVLLTGLAINAFSADGTTDALGQGYGYYCMNLNSLFNPISCSGIVWSRVLPVRPQGLGSYEGFNYLGLGLLVAFPVCALLWALRRRMQGAVAFARRYWGMLFVAACFTVFAFSTTLVYGGMVLVDIQLPAALKALCDTFRSSGRMFYPVYYLILLFTVVFLTRLPKKQLGTALLALVLAVQLWDISPALITKRQHFVDDVVDQRYLLQSDFWQAPGATFEHMFSLDDVVHYPLYPALYAAQNGMTTNDGFAARPDVAQHRIDAQAAIEQLSQGQVSTDTLYITSRRDLFISLAEQLQDVAVCAQVDELWYVIYSKQAGVQLPDQPQGMRIYPALRLLLADYSDANWTCGVLNTDPRICMVTDDAFTRRHFADADYVICDGVEYKILNKDYSDPGWLMLTLDIEDASVLVDKTLTTR